MAVPSTLGSELPMKVLGRRQAKGSLAAAADLLDLTVDLRRARPFVPKGIHRFTTFEEGDEWLLRMLTRPNLARRG